jgi:hypothetical protein
MMETVTLLHEYAGNDLDWNEVPIWERKFFQVKAEAEYVNILNWDIPFRIKRKQIMMNLTEKNPFQIVEDNVYLYLSVGASYELKQAVSHDEVVGYQLSRKNKS